MRKKTRSKTSAADTRSTRMSSFDRIVERTSSSMRTVRKDGVTKQMSMEEIVHEKLTQTALAGNPHALRQWIEHNQAAAEKRAALIVEDIVIWSAYKRRKTAEIEACRKADLPEPIILPHPDDVIIDEQTGVSFDGPVIKKEYDLALRTQSVIEALLLQEALDWRKSKIKSWPAPVLGDPLSTAMLFNRMMGTRMALTKDQLIDRRMRLASKSIRDLEKLTFRAWKNAGMSKPRGSAGIEPKTMHSIIQLSVGGAKIACDDELSKVEKDHAVDQLIHRFFG